MNCEFRILWFEDEPSWRNSPKRRIEAMLDEYCLTAKFTERKGDEIIETDLTSSHYHLILMDYQLAKGVKGTKIAERLRTAQVLADVLFYSSDYNGMIDEIRQTEPLIEGFFYTNRKNLDFNTKVKTLIEKNIRKSINIENLRGFALDNSSYFEERIRLLLRNYIWERFSEDEKNELSEAVQAQIAEKQKNFCKKATKIHNHEYALPAVFEENCFFTNADCLAILSKAIKIMHRSHGFAPENFCSSFRKEYNDSMAKFRDVLGHQSLSDDGTLEVRNVIYCIDEKFHQARRKDITNINRLLTILEDFFQPKACMTFPNE